jgi:hypothetical protein
MSTNTPTPPVTTPKPGVDQVDATRSTARSFDKAAERLMDDQSKRLSSEK